MINKGLAGNEFLISHHKNVSMKSLVLFCLFCSINLYLFGQKLNYYDLLYLTSHSTEEVDFLLGNRKFNFDSQKNEDGFIHTIYTRVVKRYVNYEIITLMFGKRFKTVSYSTEYLDNAESIRAFCKSLGYKLTKEYTDPFGDLTFEYNLGNIELDFVKTHGKSSVNVYYIYLTVFNN